VIGMSPPHGRPSRLRLVTIIVLVAVAVLVVLGLIGSWAPSAIAYTVITLVGGFVYLCYLIWEIATGRVGLIHWTPTARRQRRLARRVARRDEVAQQERLDAALSRGAYQPQVAAPPGPDPVGQARRELLEAAERHGSLSPEARAAAEKLKRLSR
jgi:hypothetical protein